MVNLTSEERQKFVEWLEQQAASNIAVMKPMAELPGGAAGILRHYKADTEALFRVAKMLMKAEEMSIGGE